MYPDIISPERMEKFDAACMLIQVIGETANKIDEWTSKQLFCNYSEEQSIKTSRLFHLIWRTHGSAPTVYDKLKDIAS